MTKPELDALNQALVILDRESNRYDIYRDDVEAFEAATEALLAVIRLASFEVSKGTPKVKAISEIKEAPDVKLYVGGETT